MSASNSISPIQCEEDIAPDIATASSDYASRFAGLAGAYLLSVQNDTLKSVLRQYRGGTLLDVGGGHGQLRDLYAELSFTFVVQGSDQSCFARLESPYAIESRVVSDLRTLPFDDDQFDIVVAVRLICHLEDWEVVLTEMCRVASVAVILDFPSKRSLNALTPLLFSYKKAIEKNTRAYTSFWPKTLSYIPASEGFTSIRWKNQLFLPMVLHRVLRGSIVSRVVEVLCRALGLTALFGSPVIQIAEKAEK